MLTKKTGSFLMISLLIGTMMFNGCASIIAGGPQTIPINSNPSDAKLRIMNARNGNAIYEGKTPYIVALDRGVGYFQKGRYNVIIEKEGYQTREIMIEGTPNGWYILGNLVLGGLIGWLIVDPITGAMWTLNPSDIKADLAAKTSFFKDGEGLMIVLKSDLPKLPESIVSKMKPVNVN